VGPEICVDVPPNSAAKKLIKIAPYKPALGPSPDATPKAKARGRATTPAVIPPKRSPRIFENKFFIKSKGYFFTKIVNLCPKKANDYSLAFYYIHF
jgi:hypothetical protein